MKKALLVFFAAGVLFAGCKKQEEVMTAPDMQEPPAAVEQAPVAGDATAPAASEAPAAPEAPAASEAGK